MPFAVCLRTLSGMCLFTLAVVCCAAAHGQQPAPPPLQAVHIGVQIRQYDGTPINFLRAKNFKISVGDKPLRVQVERPSSKSTGANAIQTRLLVILPSPPAPASADLLSEAIDQLGPVWHEGWQVAVRTPEGGLTPYTASEEELQQALHELFIAHATEQLAIDTLRDFAGRRVVMTVSKGDNGTGYTLGKAAASVQAMLYNVGGNPYDNYSYGNGEVGSTGSLPLYGERGDGASAGPATGGMHVVNNTETYTAQANFYVENVRAERSFGAAIRDARNDARSYYDILVQVTPRTPSMVLGISVGFPYQMRAQAYTSTSDPPPDLVLLPNNN
jgi:hypothetical protein